MNKLPQITLAFWLMKISATTLGETVGDLLSMTLRIGYAMSSVILISLFFLTLSFQLLSKKYHPILYWSVILTTSTSGTTISDYINRTLGLGYAKGSFILLSLLLFLFILWRFFTPSFSIQNIKTFKIELLYWMTILCSNTLGTALGDFLSGESRLGFEKGALLIGGLLGLIILASLFSKISKIFLFWLAFILTRPFGATFGDLLTKPHANGGLGFGTVGSSLVLILIFTTVLLYSTKKEARIKSTA